MAASLQLYSGWGVFLSLIVLGTLFFAWIACLFLVIADEIGPFAKVVWFVALTLLAPFVIPLYLVARHHRRAARPVGAH